MADKDKRQNEGLTRRQFFDGAAGLAIASGILGATEDGLSSDKSQDANSNELNRHVKVSHIQEEIPSSD